MATDTTHLIVGASPAGAKAAQTCQRSATTALLLIRAEHERQYHRVAGYLLLRHHSAVG